MLETVRVGWGASQGNIPTRIAMPMNEHVVSGSSSRIKHVCTIRNAISELIVGHRGNSVAASAFVVAA